MRGTKHAIAVPLFDEDRVLEGHDDGPRDTDGAERLVSLVEQQNSAIECHTRHLLSIIVDCRFEIADWLIGQLVELS
jgi:hypothetical protein